MILHNDTPFIFAFDLLKRLRRLGSQIKPTFLFAIKPNIGPKFYKYNA